SDDVDEKFPNARRQYTPFAIFGACYSMKTNTMGRNKIEFFSKIGQRNSRMNPRDHAVDIEQFGSASEERLLVGIEAEPFVTEESTDVKKISGAASKIDNAEG